MPSSFVTRLTFFACAIALAAGGLHAPAIVAAQPAPGEPALEVAPQLAPPARVFNPLPAMAAQGCAPGASIIVASRVISVCNGSEVWSFDLSNGAQLSLVEVRRAPSRPIELTLRDGVVWVSLERAPAAPLASLPLGARQSPALPFAGAPPGLVAPSPALRTVKGQVLGVKRTTALVSMGRADGLTAGDHVAVPVQDEADDALDDTLERLAVGRVAAVGDTRASVEFGLGEQVIPGSAAETSARPLTAEKLAPPRFGGMFRLEGAVRPYLPVRRAGLGALGELALTYHARVPFYFRAEVAPLGGRAGSGSARGAFGAFASLGWDHGLFAVGVGAGVLERRDYTQQTTRSGNVVTTVEDAYEETVASVAVSQFVRVGALDGFHATLTNVLAVAQSSDEWAFGYLLVRAQIPLSGTTWLCPSAGGGRGAGFVLGELGARLLVSGNGRTGSLFLKPSVGVTGVGSFPARDYVVGPLVGLHAEYRFGGAP